jgi:hypothetical protein
MVLLDQVQPHLGIDWGIEAAVLLDVVCSLLVGLLSELTMADHALLRLL